MNDVDRALACLSEISEKPNDGFVMEQITDRIFMENCLDVMAKIPDGSVDLCITDPPWGIDYESFREKFKDEKIANDELEAYRKLMEDFPYELARVLKKGAAAYIFCGATTPVTKDGRQLHWTPWDTINRFWGAKFAPRRILVWDKVTPGRGYRYRMRIEFVLYFTNQGTAKSNFFGGGEFKDEVIECDPEVEIFKYQKIHGSSKLHPAEKPVRIYESFILDSSRPGDLVMDPFAGSGPVIEACKNTNRSFLAIEKDSKYEETLKNRTRQMTLFEVVEPRQEEIIPEAEDDFDDPLDF